MEKEKILITDNDIKALIHMYGGIKFTLLHSKGLKYRQAYQFEKLLERFKAEIINKNIDLNEYYDFERGKFL